MDKYQVSLKKPFQRAIWAGPERMSDILPSRETDKSRIQRENVGRQLEELSGGETKWNKRTYSYIVKLTEEQAAEVRNWNFVRTVTKV